MKYEEYRRNHPAHEEGLLKEQEKCSRGEPEREPNPVMLEEIGG